MRLIRYMTFGLVAAPPELRMSSVNFSLNQGSVYSQDPMQAINGSLYFGAYPNNAGGPELAYQFNLATNRTA